MTAHEPTKYPTELVCLNTKDYDLLIEGVSLLFSLQEEDARDRSVRRLKEYFENHPEDGMCHIYRPSDRSMVLCKRSGIMAIHRIAQRLVEHSPDRGDLNVSEVADVISENILQVAIDNVQDDEILTERLFSYVEISRKNFTVRRYHFPCIIATAKNPKHFCFGPVSFNTAEEFTRVITEARTQRRLTYKDDVIPTFEEASMKHGWVASVEIPLCAPKTSRKRAESTIELAIGILKIFIGLGYAKGMRLPHVSPARNRKTCFLTQKDQNLDWTWLGESLDSALVGDGWFQSLPAAYVHQASHLLHASTLGKRSEIATRVQDAIRWFDDASYEEIAGVQIAKLVAAMERLTTTGTFRTHKFAKRIAFMAADTHNEESLAQAYRDARRAHGLRCDVMHGATSQQDERFSNSVQFVHDLARKALFRALEVHCHLDDAGKHSDQDRLIKLFVKQERPFSALFRKLELEFSPTPKTDIAD